MRGKTGPSLMGCWMILAGWTAVLADGGQPRDRLELDTPAADRAFTGAVTDGWAGDEDAALREGWPVDLGPPGAGFPYTPTLFDVDGDGDDEIFLTGGETFGLDGDGEFLPGWPMAEHAYMGYGTNAQKPGPSAADLEGDGDVEVLWTERDWWAGSAHMWCFNGRGPDGSNLPGFPSFAPDDYSNALDVPFVLGDADGDGILEAWGPHTLGNTFVHYRLTAYDAAGVRLFTRDLDPTENILNLHFGDLDGDGSEEFFALVWQDPHLRLYAFVATGGDAPGFPVLLASFSGGFLPFGPPLPVDLDHDGDLEILAGYNAAGQISQVHGFQHDGTPVASYPRQLATSSQLLHLGLGDLTGDAEPELLALDNHYGSDYRAFAFDLASGDLLPGWPHPVTDWPHGFPCVADVDGDGRQDLCLATHGGQLLALGADGALLPGYPKTMVSSSISGVAAGDIDGDGLFELVAATWDGWVYAWDTEGEALPERTDWPLRGVDARNTGIYRRGEPAITPTPTATHTSIPPTETPVPTAWPLGVRLDLPLQAHPGEEFHVTGYLDNPGEPRVDVPVFFVLDVFGEYWFWDDWTHLDPPDGEIDYVLRTVPTGTTRIPVVPAFPWPDTGHESVTDLLFWGAMLNPEMTDFLGRYARVTWGYGPPAAGEGAARIDRNPSPAWTCRPLNR